MKRSIQNKIEGFVEELSRICQKYEMALDTNGSLPIPVREGIPGTLVLYYKSGRKLGELSYIFNEDNKINYRFDPKEHTPYKIVETEI